jgi:hypothetical protein
MNVNCSRNGLGVGQWSAFLYGSPHPRLHNRLALARRTKLEAVSNTFQGAKPNTPTVRATTCPRLMLMYLGASEVISLAAEMELAVLSRAKRGSERRGSERRGCPAVEGVGVLGERQTERRGP